MTRIAISTRGLNQGSFAISEIIVQLTKNIIALAPNELEVTLYFNDPEYEHLFNASTHKRSAKISNRFIWDHFWLPPQLKKNQIDIALFMKGTLSFNLPCQGAVIIHDLGYFDSQLRPYRFLETIYMKKMMARAGNQASRIFTDIRDRPYKDHNDLPGLFPDL
jgi:hypothetical protein